MTEPAPSGGPSPLRVGGLALLGAGVVAALIGLATLLPGSGGNGPSTTGAAPPATESAQAAPPPAQGTPTPGPSEAVPVPSFPTTTNAVAAPNAPAAAPASPAGDGNGGGTGSGTGSGGAVQRAPVRVYNNSTVKDLAEHAAADLRGDGWSVDKVGNYSQGIIATSTVYYRPGTAEQSAASALGRDFGLRVAPRFAGIDDATPGLIVIVTKDYQKR